MATQRGGGHVRRVRGAHQPARPPAAGPGPATAGPLLHLHGEQQPLPRDVRRGRAVRPLLHVHQLAPHADELAYIVNNSDSQVFITSREKLDVARRDRRAVPGHRALARWSTARPTTAPFEDYLTRRRRLPGHTDRRRAAAARRCCTRPARPVGRRASCARSPTWRPSEALALMRVPASASGATGRARPYLSPAPLYHSAPQAAVGLTIRVGGTVIIMERFDPEQYLAARRAAPRHAQPARADDVQPHAQAARRTCARRTTCRRWRPSSTPPRRARSRSRSR